MLVLSRKLNEQILIGNNVTITILRVKGNNVRIGVEAPRSVRVVRSELPPKADDAPSADAEQASSDAESTCDDQHAEDSPEVLRMQDAPLKNRLTYYQTGAV